MKENKKSHTKVDELKQRKRRIRLRKQQAAQAQAKANQLFAYCTATEIDLTRSICRESFSDFCKTMWEIIVPETMIWNWHMDTVCNEIQAVCERIFAWKPRLYDLFINVPPGTSKPVWEESKVLMGNGQYKKLKHIVVGDEVIGKSGNVCRVSAIHKQGVQESVRIRTAYGRSIVAALDHPILTTEGWKNAGKIKRGHCVALMHRAKPEVKYTNRSDEEFEFAGYMVGDGSCSHGNCSFVNADQEYLDRVRLLASKLNFGIRERIVIGASGKEYQQLHFKHAKQKSRVGQFVGCGRGNAPKPRGPRQWMRSIKLEGKTSKTKRVPKFVWQGTDEQIGKFIAAYFHCDGTIHNNKWFSMTTISLGLARDLQRLLLRLGISTRLKRRVAKKGFKYNRTLKGYVYYQLSSFGHDANSRALWQQKIPVFGRKAGALQKTRPQRFVESFLPDKVVSVECIGQRLCRCLTVENDASFCVDGVVVHNSTIGSIMLLPWAWTRMISFRMLSGSFNKDLSLEFGMKAKQIIESERYQELFPEVKIRSDQGAKSHFANTRGGVRYCTATGASAIGRHAHLIAVDDPINPAGVRSKADLLSANRWMRETLPSRCVDPEVTTLMCIMQRLGVMDPTGERLSRSMLWTPDYQSAA